MVHPARVRHLVQQRERPREDGRLGQVAFVRQAQVALARHWTGSDEADEVVRFVRDELAGGGEGAEGEDGEGVEERVEADEDAKDDNLRVVVCRQPSMSQDRREAPRARTFSSSCGTARKLVTRSLLTPSSPSISTVKSCRAGVAGSRQYALDGWIERPNER